MGTCCSVNKEEGEVTNHFTKNLESKKPVGPLDMSDNEFNQARLRAITKI